MLLKGLIYRSTLSTGESYLAPGGLRKNHLTKLKAVFPHHIFAFSYVDKHFNVFITLNNNVYYSIYSGNTLKSWSWERKTAIHIYNFINMNTWIQFPDGYVYSSSSGFPITEIELRIDYDFISLSQRHFHSILEVLSKKLNQNGNFRAPVKYIRAECSGLMSNCILERERK